MPNIRPLSDLRNYTDVLKEVSYGERTYLTKKGHGEFALIDMKELDDLNKMLAFHISLSSFSSTVIFDIIFSEHLLNCSDTNRAKVA